MLTIGLAPSFQKHQSARKSGRFSQSANQCSPPQCGHACSRRCSQNEIDWVDYSVLLTDAATAAQCRSPPPPPHAPPSTAACCCHERLSSFSAHFVKQNENEHQATTLIEKDHKNTVKPERSGLIPVGRKFLDCIHAQLKIQVTGLQNATEIKLNPEISVITRYKNIQLVKLNKAWISRLIMAAWTHIRLFSVGISQFCVCGWWFNFKSIWIYLLALDAGSQCKVGVKLRGCKAERCKLRGFMDCCLHFFENNKLKSGIHLKGPKQFDFKESDSFNCF